MPSLKRIDVHRPKLKKLTLEQFSFFLAGLIDADGHINKLGYLIISFHRRDLSVAYDIKKRIGYGTVSLVADKKAGIFICSHPTGRRFIRQLVKNKLMNQERIKQYHRRLVPRLDIQKPTSTSKNTISCRRLLESESKQGLALLPEGNCQPLLLPSSFAEAKERQKKQRRQPLKA